MRFHKRMFSASSKVSPSTHTVFDLVIVILIIVSNENVYV